MSSYVGHAASLEAYLGPDTHANRPAAGSVLNGTLYVCTTHNMIERVVWGAWVDWASLAGAGISTVQDEGTALTARTALDFVGAGVTATDDAANNRTLVTIPGSGGGATVSYGTTLPASPVDGQEAILVDSTINPSYQWRFRWNAGSSSAYKWEFVGGNEAFVTVLTDEATTNGGNTFMDVATPGPGLSLPRAGDWDAWGGTSFYSDTVQQALRLTIAKNNTTAFQPFVAVVNPAANLSMSIMTSARLTALIAGDIAKLLYAFQGGGTKHVVDRWIRVRPVRVS